MKKRNLAFFLVFALFLCSFLSVGALASETDPQRIFDQADLFSDEEERSLEEQAALYRDETSLDLAIVTTDDAQGQSARAYADDFYDSHDFGVGARESGALLLFDMDNRVVHITTKGAGISVMPDSQLQELTGEIADQAKDGDYAGGAELFLSRMANPGTDSQSGASLGSYVVPFLLISLAAGGTAVGMVAYRYKRAYKADQYELRENSHVDLQEREDIFLGRFVTSREISRNDSGGNSTHRSSSGDTHGGTGSRF